MSLASCEENFPALFNSTDKVIGMVNTDTTANAASMACLPHTLMQLSTPTPVNNVTTNVNTAVIFNALAPMGDTFYEPYAKPIYLLVYSQPD
jgi:hypothetical protein